MGGAARNAPPIFYWAHKFASMPDNQLAYNVPVSYGPLDIVEEFCDQTLPCRDFVRRCLAVPSDQSSNRSRSFRGGSSCGGFKDKEEKQSQENEEAKNIEGPSRQAHSKARLTRNSWKIRLRIVANGQGQVAMSAPPGAPIRRLAGCVAPIERLAFPGGKDQNGEPGGSPFQRFSFLPPLRLLAPLAVRTACAV